MYKKNARQTISIKNKKNTMTNKDQIKRELAELLPEDTSSDVITRLATYISLAISKREEEIVEGVEKLKREDWYTKGNANEAIDRVISLIKGDKKEI